MGSYLCVAVSWLLLVHPIPIADLEAKTELMVCRVRDRLNGKPHWERAGYIGGGACRIFGRGGIGGLDREHLPIRWVDLTPANKLIVGMGE